MPVRTEFRNHVLEMLEPLGPVRARSMFGGAGIYLGDTMFALIADDSLYFKTDAKNRGDYETLGMAPFKPFDDKPMIMPYHEVPPDVMEDQDTLCAWAKRAWEAARRGAKTKDTSIKRRRKPCPGKSANAPSSSMVIRRACPSRTRSGTRYGRLPIAAIPRSTN
jgi:DNA transformation protein